MHPRPSDEPRSSLALLAARLPFFYGWVIVGMSIVSGFLASGMTNLVMGVLLKPMSEDLGWSRTLVAGALAAGTVGGGVLAPIIGRLADRRGPRLLMSGGAAIVGSLFLALPLTQAAWQFYAVYIPGRALSVNAMVGVVPLTAVANWFFAKRPRAMGMVSMALALGGSLMALAAQLLIERFGWRAVPFTFGVLVWLLVVVPGALLLRRQPEDLGLLPDGAKPADPSATAPASQGRGPQRQRSVQDGYDWSLSEALHTPALWFIVSSYGLAAMAHGSIGFHQVAYYIDQGLAPTMAALALSIYAFSGAVSNVVWGFLAERVSDRLLNIGALLFSAGCMIFLIQVQSVPSAFLFSVLFGLAARGEGALVNIILAHYYGRKSFGAISGFTIPFQMAGVGLGPLLAAATFDLTGSYVRVFLFYSVTYVVAAFLMFLARQPKPPAGALVGASADTAPAR
ncbi:MAG: MFS transporter [Chloroflexi bacterium]|nr:MFS transporter [Chloroflexota bacterium]